VEEREKTVGEGENSGFQAVRIPPLAPLEATYVMELASLAGRKLFALKMLMSSGRIVPIVF
jgi:uncharacterized protein YvpB